MTLSFWTLESQGTKNSFLQEDGDWFILLEVSKEDMHDLFNRNQHRKPIPSKRSWKVLGNHALKIIISSSGTTPTNKSRKINKSTQEI